MCYILHSIKTTLEPSVSKFFSETEVLEKIFRAAPGFALTLLIALGATALILISFLVDKAAALASRLAGFCPIVITIELRAALVAQGRARRSARRGDEVRIERRAAPAKPGTATGKGLVVVLLAQPLLAGLLAWLARRSRWCLMVGVTACVGCQAPSVQLV